jgi:hypothetical protein
MFGWSYFNPKGGMITAAKAEEKREKLQALSLAKECYSMKLELLTNATVVDDAIRFVSDKSNNKNKSVTQPGYQGYGKDQVVSNQVY